VILAAARHDFRLFPQYAPSSLLDCRDFVLQVASIARVHFHFDPPATMVVNDRELAFLALQNPKNVGLYQKLSAEFRNDKELLLAAATYDRSVLRFASADLRQDRELLLEAGKSYGCGVLHAAPKEWLDDDDFVLQAIRIGGDHPAHVPDRLRFQEDFNKARLSHLAYPGEENSPAVTLRIEHSPDRCETGGNVLCEFTFVSGRSVSIPQSEEATVNDLVKHLVDHRPDDMKAFRTVFAMLEPSSDKEDGDLDCQMLTPWDGARPLKSLFECGGKAFLAGPSRTQLSL